MAPERYLDAHDDAEADALRAQVGPKAPYQGNTNDVIALVAAVVGVVAFSVNFGGMYVLPLFGLVLGIVAVLQARQSLNRKRTQTLGWVAIGSSLVGIVIWGVFILGCLGLTFLPLFIESLTRNGP
ncbi:MAG TPA: hypothetical protein PLC98_17885 [Anaerolineales bacterium]|nr:hypothetical protein [Anaerolineales bacterium]